MATELRRQVQQHNRSLQGGAASSHGGSGQPSLFLSPAEAAAVDVSTVHEAALKGVQELAQYDEAFRVFEETLLHPSSISLQRELKTADENKQLDQSIDRLLALLSLYASKESAHLVIEYLIRRYKVHEMNADSLLRCMLIMHNTKVFARIAQLCHIKNTPWEFLVGVKRSGVPLPRQVLVKQIAKESHVLTILTESMQLVLTTTLRKYCTDIRNDRDNANEVSSSSLEGAGKMLTFFTAAVTEAIGVRPFDDARVRIVFLYIIEGLKNKYASTIVTASMKKGRVDHGSASALLSLVRQWRQSSCIIVAQLCLSTNLGDDVLEKMSFALVESISMCYSLQQMQEVSAAFTVDEALITLMAMAQELKLRFSNKAVVTLRELSLPNNEHAASSTNLLKDIKRLSADYSSSGLVLVLLHRLLQTALGEATDVDSSKMADAMCAVLNNLLGLETQSANAFASSLVMYLLQFLGSADTQVEAKDRLRNRLTPVFRILYQRFPMEFELALQQAADAGNEDSYNQLVDIISKSLDVPRQIEQDESGGASSKSLLLSLLSPIVSLKIAALRSYSLLPVVDVQSSDVVSLAEAATIALTSASAEVAAAAWEMNIVTKICTALDHEEIYAAFASAIARWTSPTVFNTSLIHQIIKSFRGEYVLKQFHSTNVGSNSFARWIMQLALVFSSAQELLLYGGASPHDLNTLEMESFYFLQDVAIAMGLSTTPAPSTSTKKTKKSKGGSKTDSMVSVPESSQGRWQAILNIFQETVNRSNDCILHSLTAAVQDVKAHEEKKSPFDVLCVVQLIHFYSDLCNQTVSSSAATVMVYENIVRLIDNINWTIFADAIPSLSSLLLTVCTSAQQLVKQKHFEEDKRHLSAAYDNFTDPGHFTSQLVAPIDESERSMRLLEACLKCPFVPVRGTSGEMLLNIFGDDAGLVLIRLIMLDALDNTTMTSSVTLSALQLLAACALLRDGKALPPFTGASCGNFIAALLPIILTFASSAEDQIRRAVISLSQRVLELTDSSKATLAAVDAAVAAVIKSNTSTSGLKKKKWNALKVLRYLVENQDAVAAEPDSCRNLLSDRIFHGGSEDFEAGLCLCVLSYTFYSWGFPGFSEPVFIASITDENSSASSQHLGAASATLFILIQQFLQSLPESLSSQSVSAVAKLMDTLLRVMLQNFENEKAEQREQIIEWIETQLNEVSSINASGTEHDDFTALLISKLLGVIPTVATSATDEQKTVIYSALMSQHREQPRHTELTLALKGLNAPLMLYSDTLRELVQELDLIKVPDSGGYENSDEIDGMDIDHPADEQKITASILHRRTVAFVELLNEVLQSLRGELSNASIAALRRMMIQLMNLTRMLCGPVLKGVFRNDYAKAVVLETGAAVATAAQHRLLSTADVEEVNARSTKSKSKRSNSSSEISYDVEMVKTDVNSVLNCISTSQQSQVHRSAMALLKQLVQLAPASVIPSLQCLGELLASSTVGTQLTKDNFVEQILQTMVAMFEQNSEARGEEAYELSPYIVQSIVQSVCKHFELIPNFRRLSLLRLTCKVLRKSSTVLPAAAFTLLLHVASSSLRSKTFSSHQNDQDAVTRETTTVLLSKSAQRKAHRMLKTSAAEEMYQSAIDLIVAVTNPVRQIGSIVTMLQCAYKLYSSGLALNSDSAVEMIHVAEVGKLDATLAIQYLNEIIVIGGTGNNDLSSTGCDVTLGLLLLELISDLLSHPTLRKKIKAMWFAEHNTSSLTDTDTGNTQSGLHQCFLTLAEVVLQLLGLVSENASGQVTAATTVACLLPSSTRDSKSVDGEAMQHRVPTRLLNAQCTDWCYDAIAAIQRLMDGPSFISLLQELLRHENATLRQKALGMLAERLESMMSSGKQKHLELSLFQELHDHLMEHFKLFIKSLGKAIDQQLQFTDATQETSFLQDSRFTQSAVLCIEVLVRFLGHQEEWKALLTEHLQEFISLLTLLGKLPIIGSHVKVHLYSECVKLQSSALLCCATFASVLGIQIISMFPGMMRLILSAFQHHSNELGTVAAAVVGAKGSKAVGSTGKKTKHAATYTVKEAAVLQKVHVLFVRSALSAVGIIVAAVPKLCHPHIAAIFASVLPLEKFLHHAERGSNDDRIAIGMLREDIDRCLSTVAASIPLRLSTPSILKCAPSALSGGHPNANRFADFIAELWQRLDRNAVIAHLGDLSTTAALMLDYRRVYGELQSEETREVDLAVAEAVLQLCLKLTETELKSFLARLSEWKDVSLRDSVVTDAVDMDEGQDAVVSNKERKKREKARKRAAILQQQQQQLTWRSYARSVAFYTLLQSSITKLRVLFVPVFVNFWDDSAHVLEKLPLQCEVVFVKKKEQSSNADVDPRVGGKRKGAPESLDAQSNTELEVATETLNEVLLLCRTIIPTVTIFCEEDSGDYLTEERFELMTQAVLSTIPCEGAFADDEEYLEFVGMTASCMASLALAVGKDILWKPANHNILMMMRSSKKVVRLAAIKVLLTLFQEIGEEYLVMLPECLPFLSELMEDSDRDVVSSVNGAIRFIEELSGEKLDEYLQ